MSAETLNIVVPFYNEELVIEEFHKRLMEVINNTDISTKIIYVDDGSTDNTELILKNLATSDERLLIVQFSRNFGKEPALSAGLDLADADIIITMDGDGQHPPELIPQLIENYRKGFDIVEIQRIDTQGKLSFKALSSRLFYLLFNQLSETKIIEGTTDYRLISRQVLDAYRKVHDYHRFNRGIISWLGFSEIYILSITQKKESLGKVNFLFRNC